MKTVTLIQDDKKKIVELSELPDFCPYCFSKGYVNILTSYSEGDILQIAVQCPGEGCHGIFIGTYRLSYNSRYGGDIYNLMKVQPNYFIPHEFSENIQKLSASFCTIYNQALQAESIGLDQICGCGFRKSLEYLIIDYLCILLIGKEINIKGKRLGKLIEEFITDPRIKSTASRASWLGNDETHYYRKWTDKDIEDLKTLIQITVNWIEIELLTKMYEEDMPKSSPS